MIMEDGKIKLHHCACIKQEEHNYTGKQFNGSTASSKIEWGDEDTELLLMKYDEYINLVGPMKKFKRKKELWMQISNDIEESLLFTRSPLQCENRYKTVMKRKRKLTESHSSHMEIIFDEDTIVMGEEAVASHSSPIEINQCAEELYEQPELKRHKNNQALIDFLKEKEVARERRHQEKLAMMEKLIQTLAGCNDT